MVAGILLTTWRGGGGACFLDVEMNNLIRLTKVNVEYMHGSRFGNTLLEAELFPFFLKKKMVVSIVILRMIKAFHHKLYSSLISVFLNAKSFCFPHLSLVILFIHT